MAYKKPNAHGRGGRRNGEHKSAQSVPFRPDSVQRIKAAIDPTAFYRDELGNIKMGGGKSSATTNATAVAYAVCPFHDDHKPSMVLFLDSGGFCCFACQSHGGDIIAFTMQRYGLDFKAAMATIAKAWGIRI